jgi:AcrR family transcriptional regulator
VYTPAVSRSVNARRGSPRVKAVLLNAASRAFGRQGYVKATVQHILDEANLTRRTFYRHFSSKDEIFAELLDGLVDDLCASATIATAEQSLRTRLRRRMAAGLRRASTSRFFLRAVGEAIRVNEEHARRWDRLGDLLEAQHRAALGWCVEHGVMGSSDTVLLSRILTEIDRSVLLDVARYPTAKRAILGSTMADLYWNMLFRPHEGADDYLLGPGPPKAVFARAHSR